MRWIGCLAALTGHLSQVAAQTRSGADVGVAVVGVASDPGFLGLGPTVGLRLSREFSLGLTGIGGWRGGDFTGRGELVLRLDFTRSRAPTRWYGAGGLASTTGSAGGEYLVGLIGVERGRGGRWWAEAGFGGGVRLALGRRWPIARRSVPRQIRASSRLGATSR